MQSDRNGEIDFSFLILSVDALHHEWAAVHCTQSSWLQLSPHPPPYSRHQNNCNTNEGWMNESLIWNQILFRDKNSHSEHTDGWDISYLSNRKDAEDAKSIHIHSYIHIQNQSCFTFFMWSIKKILQSSDCMLAIKLIDIFTTPLHHTQLRYHE